MPEAAEDFYEYHKEKCDTFFSDRIIYSRNVTVFKTDDEVPQMMPQDKWFQVDVLTCSAPYIKGRRYTNKAALLDLFESRIQNILDVARDNSVDVLIFGAFGCGAFGNPPDLVAKAFYNVLEDMNGMYKTFFKKIVFAIKSSVGNDLTKVCPNIAAFRRQFSEELRLGKIEGKSEGCADECKIDMPKGTIQGTEFMQWQCSNPYYRKQFSILGDSISTLAGYNPSCYNIFYQGEKCQESGVHEFFDTWWGKVIGFLGGELLINDSWSGSRVTKLPDAEQLFPSACSDERTSNLHIKSRKDAKKDIIPDVIIIYMGTNDWAFGSKIQKDNVCVHMALLTDERYFHMAYHEMLRKIRLHYPIAEIWCCSLLPTYITGQEFEYPYDYAGRHIEEYNEAIRQCVWERHIQFCDENIRYISISSSL